VFVYLLFVWSKQILSDETQLYFLNFVHQLEQQLENKTFNASRYLSEIFVYGDGLLAWLGICVGQKVRFDEKITFLKKSVISDCCSLTDETFPTMSEMSSRLSPQRLLNCYTFQMIMDDKENEQGPNVLDTCRNALDLSLKQCGKQHWCTAFCYLKMGLAENNDENYISALNAFEQALEIMTATHDGSSSSNADLADVYIGKGEAYECLNKFESAIASFEEALRIKRKLCDEGTEEIAKILVLLGYSQLCLNDLSSSLATLDQALQIRKKLYAEKPSPNGYIYVAQCYCLIGDIHNALGNNTESIKCFKTALEVSTDCDQERSIMQCFICVELINLKVDENVYLELLQSSLPVIKGNNRSFLPLLYSRLGSKQVTSGKYKAGLASFQEALDIELEIILRNHAIREATVLYYIEMAVTLINIGKFKLARKTIERATQIVESLPECRKHFGIFRCNYWKGRIQIEMREYVAAIDSLKLALLQLPKILHESCDKLEVFACHKAIAVAYFFVGSYKDALTAFYDALSVIKDIFPEGSVAEAQVYLFVAKSAHKMKNKTLEVSNFRLAYKMYSKVLGEAHSQTQITYIAYARALISLR
jgi:tetratricopeptide (TPR) repeat protein